MLYGIGLTSAFGSQRTEQPDSLTVRQSADTAVVERAAARRDRKVNPRRERRNAAAQAQADSLSTERLNSSLDERAQRQQADTIAPDSAKKRGGGAFLDDIIEGKNTDSLVFDARNRLIYIYNEGDVTYQNMNLKADFMRVNLDTKNIYAYGKPDSVDGVLVMVFNLATTPPSLHQAMLSL